LIFSLFRVDSSKKAFFKEFKQVVDAADVILQVLDARDPIGCRVKEVEQMVLEGGSDKRIVLVLNKIGIKGIFVTVFYDII